MTINDLPFIICDSDGRITNAWSVAPSGDYSADCATGRRYFEMLQRHAAENPIITLRVFQAIIAEGQCEGIEIGFLSAMAEHIA